MSKIRPKDLKKPGYKEKLAVSNLRADKAKFEAMQHALLPSLIEDVRNGLSAQEIARKNYAKLTARKVAIAATSENEAVALAAIKDIADRVEGRPVERKELKHSLSEMNEKEIDAILVSELATLESEPSSDDDNG